jgi:hypothetical protein
MEIARNTNALMRSKLVRRRVLPSGLRCRTQGPRSGRRSPSWSSQAERRARRRAEVRPSARSAAAWQRCARSPPSASHRAGQTSLYSREHDARLEEGTPVDDRHGAIHAKPDACDDEGHVPRVPTWASCTPGDFFQQLPAVRPQFEHRGGPDHEQPPATGSADHFPRQPLPVAHIAADHSPVAEACWNEEMWHRQ